jgi:hypothetical protein
MTARPEATTAKATAGDAEATAYVASGSVTGAGEAVPTDRRIGGLG